MKTLSIKKVFGSVITACLLLLVLGSCKKDVQAKNVIRANDANETLAKSNIIYTDISPDVTDSAICVCPINPYNLDLNNDDTTDFKIEPYISHSGLFGPTVYGVRVFSFKKNRVACDTMPYPLALNINDPISSNLNWASANIDNILRALRMPGNYWWGNWTTITDHYLGLKIKFGNSIYYGWARLSVSVLQGKSSFTIKDYAYNAMPNKPILAGQMK